MNPDASPSFDDYIKTNKPPTSIKVKPYPNDNLPYQEQVTNSRNPYIPQSPQGFPTQGAYGARQPPPPPMVEYPNRGYQGYGRPGGLTNQVDPIEATCMFCLPVCATLACCTLCLQ